MNFRALAAAVLAVAAWASCPRSAWGQAGTWEASVGAAYRKLVQAGLLKPHQASPTSATGFSAPEAPTRLPDEKRSGPDPKSLLLHHADSFTRSGPKLAARGGVHFSYRRYDVWADQADGDLDTDVFRLAGDVRVQGEEQEIAGEQVVVDFRNKTFAFQHGSAKLGPGIVQGGIQGDLFLRGESGGGSRRQVTGEGGEVTTCDRDHPHFEFVSQHADVKPGKRAVLRKVRLNVLGRKVAEIPYVVIPLQDYGDRYIPEFGHSRDEGYYVKSKFGTPLPGDSWFDTRIDYFSRLGMGLGGDWRYFDGPTRGLVRAYAITGGPDSRLYSVDHRQRLFGGDLKLDGSWLQNNYLAAPNARNYTGRASYLLTDSKGTTRLAFTRTGSKSPSFGSVQQSLALSDSHTWSPKLKTSLDVNLVSSDNGSATTGSVSRRKQLDVRFRGNQDLDRAALLFEYQRSVPIGTSQAYYGLNSQTPLATLETDARRLLPASAAQRWPFRTSLSLGELTDSVQKSPMTRLAYEFAMQNSKTLANQSGASYGVRFEQGMYSDGTAQYVLGTDLSARYAFGPRSSVNLRYNYLRPYGYTPLSIDRTGQNNEVMADVAYSPHRTLSISAQTSYDILELKKKRTPWQTVGVRSEWKPNGKLLVRSQADYDSFNQVWRNVRTDAGWRVSKGFVSVGTRFDGTRHTWGAVNLLAQGLQWGRVRTSLLLNYSGYSKKFESKHVSLIYDMHCTEAILQVIEDSVGFRSGRTVAFYIRVKAFPFDTPFGIGTRGQPLGTGTGLGF